MTFSFTRRRQTHSGLPGLLSITELGFRAGSLFQRLEFETKLSRHHRFLKNQLKQDLLTSQPLIHILVGPLRTISSTKFILLNFDVRVRIKVQLV